MNCVKELVLLPGFGFHSTVFQKLILKLSHNLNLRITLIDLPGFGNTSVINTVQMKRPSINLALAVMAEEILKRAPQKAVWLGWSLGGLITLWLARMYPEYIERFITIGTTPKFIEDEEWQGVSHNTFQVFQQNLEKNPQKTLKTFLSLQGFGKEQETIQYLEKHICINSIASLQNIQSLKTGLEILEKTDLRKEISKIHCSGLCMFGEKDQLVPMAIANNLQMLAPQIKTSIILNQGHGSFLFDPKHVLDEIENFSCLAI